MRLSQEDGKLYYQLWIPLLDFVNETYHIDETQGSLITAERLDLAVVHKISDRLWSDAAILDRYLEEHPEFSTDSRRIILGWKRHKKDNKGSLHNRSGRPANGQLIVSDE